MLSARVATLVSRLLTLVAAALIVPRLDAADPFEVLSLANLALTDAAIHNI